MNLTKSILVFISLIRLAAGEVVEVKNNKGTYYEIHRLQDGSHAFYYVPTYDAQVTIYGSREKRTILGFNNLQGKIGSAKLLLKDAHKAGLINDQDRLITFVVDVAIVDKLTMEHGFMAGDGMPTGTTYVTDLIWLINESKVEGRYKDQSKNSNSNGADKSTIDAAGKTEGGKNPKP